MAEKTINVDQTVRYLNRNFGKLSSEAEKKLGPATRQKVKKNGRTKVVTSKLYDYQVDFAYMINEIQRGPRYIIPKRISQANVILQQLQEEIEAT